MLLLILVIDGKILYILLLILIHALWLFDIYLQSHEMFSIPRDRPKSNLLKFSHVSISLLITLLLTFFYFSGAELEFSIKLVSTRSFFRFSISFSFNELIFFNDFLYFLRISNKCLEHQSSRLYWTF